MRRAICLSQSLGRGETMDKSCETCRYDLGGGRYNCRLNVEQECRDGGGYECWEPKEDAEDVD